VDDTHEPSYYEIALTNRQVIVAFVILLACLLSAFFSGVWIGRESTARAAAEQLVRNTPPRAAKQGQNLEELDFFNKAPETKGGPAQPETPSGTETPSDTTLLEDLGGESAAPAKAPETPASETAAAQGGDQAAADTAEARRERHKKRKERLAEKAAAAAAAKGGGTPPAPSATASVRPPQPSAPVLPKGSVVIQVFSSPDRGQAEAIRAKLAGGGYQAYLSPIERGGRTMYRVRVGPFTSKAEAQKVADKVRTGFKLDTWVTE
jgi:cell division protein FtsN